MNNEKILYFNYTASAGDHVFAHLVAFPFASLFGRKNEGDCDRGIPLCRKVDRQLSSETLNHEMPPFRRRHLGWIL